MGHAKDVGKMAAFRRKDFGRAADLGYVAVKEP